LQFPLFSIGTLIMQPMQQQLLPTRFTARSARISLNIYTQFSGSKKMSVMTDRNSRTPLFLRNSWMSFSKSLAQMSHTYPLWSLGSSIISEPHRLRNPISRERNEVWVLEVLAACICPRICITCKLHMCIMVKPCSDHLFVTCLLLINVLLSLHTLWSELKYLQAKELSYSLWTWSVPPMPVCIQVDAALRKIVDAIAHWNLHQGWRRGLNWELGSAISVNRAIQDSYGR